MLLYYVYHMSSRCISCVLQLTIVFIMRLPCVYQVSIRYLSCVCQVPITTSISCSSDAKPIQNL